MNTVKLFHRELSVVTCVRVCVCVWGGGVYMRPMALRGFVKGSYTLTDILIRVAKLHDLMTPRAAGLACRPCPAPAMEVLHGERDPISLKTMMRERSTLHLTMCASCVTSCVCTLHVSIASIHAMTEHTGAWVQ